MKAAFYTLGCKVNQYETQIMEQRMQAAGYRIVKPDESADVYVVNSCTVTAESDRKTRQILRRLKKNNPDALMVLSGCFPQSSLEKAQCIQEADVITGTRERGRIDEIIGEALSTGCRMIRVSDFDRNEKFEDMKAEGFIERTRAYVKIEDGCSRYCSYCIIPYSRGPVRSKPPDQLRNELLELARNHYHEIVLVGINLSAYGSELGLNLSDALEAAERLPGNFRIRLGSLEPNLIDDAFVSRIGSLRRLCPHFHLSLQSGCAQTLQRMNRHYSPEEFKTAVNRLRAAFPGCGITTDVIVGFPGETDEEFADSLKFVEKIDFSQIHVFAYSRREGTKAAALSGQIEKSVKEQRSRAMILAGENSKKRFWESQIGKTLSVLFESGGKPDEFEGFAPNYVPVRVRSADDLHGKLAEVTVTGCDNDACLGELAAKPA